jgi:hypothetical protein
MLSRAFDDEPYHVMKTWFCNQNTKHCVEQKAPLKKRFQNKLLHLARG